MKTGDTHTQGRCNKVIVLAAGFGTRLRPLTLTTPKPLLPLNGELIIDHQLHYLARYGITDVIINLHHLGEKIMAHVGNGSRYNLGVVYSKETNILGTGGGIKNAETFFDGETFITLNAKTLINANITELIEHHWCKGAIATMVLTRRPEGDKHTAIEVDHSGFITGFGKGKYIYTGLQVLGPEMLAALPPAGQPSCIVRDGYIKLLKAGAKINAFIHDGYFAAIETLESYEKARRDHCACVE